MLRCQAILPIVVVLPVPLTPTIISTAGSALRSIGARPVAATSARISIRRVADGDAVGGDGAGVDLVLEPFDHRGGGRGAGVGEDQRLLEPLPGLVVDPVEEAGRDLLGQRLAAFGEALAQAPEDAAALLLGLSRRRGVRARARTEVDHLLPARRHRRRRAICAAARSSSTAASR